VGGKEAMRCKRRKEGEAEEEGKLMKGNVE
jgi:hypothetical protein